MLRRHLRIAPVCLLSPFVLQKSLTAVQYTQNASNNDVFPEPPAVSHLRCPSTMPHHLLKASCPEQGFLDSDFLLYLIPSFFPSASILTFSCPSLPSSLSAVPRVALRGSPAYPQGPYHQGHHGPPRRQEDKLRGNVPHPHLAICV